MHGQYKALKLPIADVIICTGDMTNRGSSYEVKLFFDWFSSLTLYDKRICIAGNHDIDCDENPLLIQAMIPENVDYLLDSSVIYDEIKFYGTPYQPMFFDWAFNLPDKELADVWASIPDGIDVLLTHCPPKGILDLAPAYREFPETHAGSASLFREVTERIKPKLHAFGHIHEGYGTLSTDTTTFINACNMDGHYRLVNNPIIIEI